MVQLYHHPLDPASRFVRLVLAEYGIEPELVEERTFERRHEFLLLNPAATLPVLVEPGGAVVPGAGPIAEYLDETRGHTLGERRLLPEAPGERVEVRVEVVADRVRFSILDEGEGITPENAARATEPFFTTKAAGRGTGIGLSIAQELVLHHGGTLRVVPRSDGTRGTEATVEVPLIRGGPA